MFLYSPNASITTPERRPMGYEFYQPFSHQQSPVMDAVLSVIEQQSKAFVVREFVPFFYDPEAEETPSQRKEREAKYWDCAAKCADTNFRRWLVILSQLEFIDWAEIPRWKINEYPHIRLLIAVSAEVAHRTIRADEQHEARSGSGVGKRSFHDIINATSARCWINGLFKICLAWGFLWDEERREFSWPTPPESDTQY